MTILQDTFGRTFPYLRLSLTEVCNFKCNYCLPNGYEKKACRPDPLSLPELRRLIEVFASAGTRKVRLTGGEPSLRQDLPDIIRTIKNIPGIRTVAITTNGYKLPERIDSWHEAGLDSMNISIDSLEPSQFKLITGHDRLQECLDGIARALELGIKVKINAVLLKQFNGDKLGQYLDWIKSRPVSLRFIELMETGDQPQFFEEQHVAGEEIRQQLIDQGWQRQVRSADAGPAQEFWHPDYEGRIGLIMPYSKDFCATCNRLRVSEQGKLQLCLFSEGGHDLRPWLQSDDQSAALLARIQECLQIKEQTHYLHDRITGGTRNLSQIGG